MIDLHCHILPGIDDGADSPETALKMIETAAAKGIKVIVASSHYSVAGDNDYDKVYQEMVPVAAQNGIELLPGMEYDYDRLSEIPDEKLRTIGKSDYVLIDLKQPYVSSGMDQIFFSIRLKGKKIIVAHPERLWRMNFRENLKKLAGDQVLQLNSGSLLGRYGVHVCRAAWAILQEAHCCLIAGDAHKPEGFCADQCMALLKKYFPVENVDVWMVENPRRLLAGEALLRTKMHLTWQSKLKLKMAFLTGRIGRR